MSFLRWFFGTDKNNAHIGPAGAQGMVVLDRTPPKTVEQVRAEEAARRDALGPRTWEIFEGHGRRIGTAVELTDGGIVRALWDAKAHPQLAEARTDWVDEEAFQNDMEDPSRLGFTGLYRVTAPVRIRYRPRDAREREAEEIRRSFF